MDIWSAARGVQAGMLDEGAKRAIQYYDQGGGQRLSGAGGANPFRTPNGYARFDTTPNAIMDNTSNPDTAVGDYMTISETLPNYLRLQGSGETDTSGESWRRANAARMANNRYRLVSPSPILDAPAGSTSAEIGRRIAELQGEVASAAVPMADERWQRTTGWTPPGFLSDAGDFAVSMVDPTVAIPAVRGAGALTNATRAALKGSRIAGAGWIAPVVRNAVGPVSKEMVFDMGVEQAAGTALLGPFGGMPGRSDSQFWRGGGQPGVDFSYKTDDEVAEARRAGDQLHARLKDDDGVSRADSEAYKRLVASGAIDPFSGMGLTPQGRLNPLSPLNKQ
jgi:hypothetical protein